ncbi:outer membrane lipoprotein-sorting protein [Treponema zuelzerae]|uniref:Outer membrane lipoprotein-sorting protein n=1 Tax=Teretinema zuelzerae TaxID=156 RepID=A0AAE3JM31_9SPIR|nr:outer membrane lipoprotein-sorting protein [Teretinema zuelzerae]MCD1655349.1 outer membrane lipoprotein-sorting protein [Teretinema zuelzerae]
MKHRLILAAALAAAFSLALGAQDADSIVKSSRDRIKADTVSSRARMIITAKDGSSSERLLDQYSSDAKGITRSMIVFQKPASVAGTRFLTIETASGADDRWIYLPALGKVRRIAASEGSGRFVGTDFSYDDISSATRDFSADSHRVLKEEELRGSLCHVVESTPKDSGYQYSKMISWIAKDSLIALRIELYDRKGTHVKTVDILETKDVQGRLTPMVTKMSTIADGTSTEIRMEIMKYDDPIPEGVFTTDFLSTGRVR